MIAASDLVFEEHRIGLTAPAGRWRIRTDIESCRLQNAIDWLYRPELRMTATDTHEFYMKHALALARQALARDDFPVGCVVTYDGRVVAEGARIHTRRPVPSEIDHAEIVALRRLETVDSRLDRGRMTLYATLEPCLMCFGAVLISGIGRLVYAYEDAMGGATACDRSVLPELYRNDRPAIVSGVCREESLYLFQSYFRRPHVDYWRDSLLARYTLRQSCRIREGTQ